MTKYDYIINNLEILRWLEPNYRISKKVNLGLPKIGKLVNLGLLFSKLQKWKIMSV